VSLVKKAPKGTASRSRKPEAGKGLALSFLSWGVTILLVAIMILVLFRGVPFTLVSAHTESTESPAGEATASAELPAFTPAPGDEYLVRLANLNTTLPKDARSSAVKYTVQPGDSIFSISKEFNIKPETILWANYDLLNDDPTFLSPGWQLTIPPTDGVYYKWQPGDSLAKVAEKYYVKPEDIIRWPSNHMDITNPSTDGLEYVMIPGGYRDIQSWIVPLAYTSGAGATRVIEGPGGCEATSYQYIGSGGFMWPTPTRGLSGFDFSSYHLAIDISAMTGDPVYASDWGTVVYAGWNSSGYGNLVVIDHGNGYETLYAHLSQVYVSCGQGVAQGAVIAAAGDTGRSYGSHLHFEVRLNGGFVNPWSVLN
jgi:LysM repeat protein